ncbi:MAG: acyltransferase domain-containing protein, partial [Elusimicrobia bacterium]|nr:acyltransferase domain-containing protein [Elusimicrobiota bacterium]
MNNEKIAIIGIGVIAPGALNKEEFWNNVLNRKNCITEVPSDRWDCKLYYDPDPKAKDKTYSKIGGFIQGFKFDPIKYKIPPNTSEQISRLQKMTIEACRMAIEDSGYASWDKPMTGKQFDPKRTAVVIGNAMGAMRKELTDLRVYKFYSQNILKKTKAFSSLDSKKQTALIEEYEDLMDSSLLPITEDTMPGELSNVTAGRIANVFNLNGPNMTMDAACASSMAAMDYAVLGLRAGKFDMALCGGADEMMSAPAYVKFCKIGALSPDGSWAFDERANGFVMAEGVGIYILKRLLDAVRDGDRIYALVNAVGASSDGKGKGITAPNPKGQKLAVENAFEQVDYGPGDVELIEAHGTATRVGDAAEVSVLNEVFGSHVKPGHKIGLGSIKSQIGHSKAAAGALSIAKTALALYNKTLPPSINFEKPNPNIDFAFFRVITKPEEWKTDKIRRANVSSFGFGGANFHVAMEEFSEKAMREARDERRETRDMVEDLKFPFSSLQGEAITFHGDSPEDLKKRMDSFVNSTLNGLAENHPMILFSHKMNSTKPGAFGVSIVAKSISDLKEKISFFFKNASPEVWQKNTLHLKMKSIYPFKYSKNKAKIGYIFPGQGSQYVDMMRDLAYKYRIVQETFDEADGILEKMINVKLTEVLWSKPGETKEELEKREAAIKQTQMTQPSVMTADMAMFRLLESFGIKPDMVIGHSLGEYAAAVAAGVFTLENGLKAVTSRAKEMSNVKVKDPGKMASIAWPFEKVERELKKIKGYVICANKNCPTQTVIAGEKEAVDEAVNLFNSLGAQAQEIAVSHAFHSAIIEPAIPPYRQFLERIPISPFRIPLLSNVTADFFPNDVKSIYDLLVRQMVSPVEFIKQLEKMYAEGVRIFIECGPKRVLSAFTTSTLKDKPDITVLASNHPKRGGITELNDLIANLISLGVDLNWTDADPMTSKKLYNPYYLNWVEQVTSHKLQVTSLKSQVSSLKSQDTICQPPATSNQIRSAELAEKFGFNFNNISVSGIAGGTPGTWDSLFREKNLDEILSGHNMIEPIPKEWQYRQIDKNIIRVIKSATGHHRIEKLDTVDEAIKLSARSSRIDMEKDFGVPHTVAKALNSTFKMAIGAGILALKDAGIPLIHYYKKTTTGGYLPEKWALPGELAGETAVIFASAFPVLESLITEITNYFLYKYRDKSASEMWEVYEKIAGKLPESGDKQLLRNWMEKNFEKYRNNEPMAHQVSGAMPPDRSGAGKEPFTFSQNFLLKVIPIADSQFAQWVGAKGPIIHLSAACSSTTQSVHVAESWIRSGKAKRVIIIAGDDITNEIVSEWTMPGFVASGTATTKDKISEAALPFDRRRHGLIVGSGAVGMVIEDETLIKARGMKPLARLLLSDAANSAYHVTRLDTAHVAQVMSNFLAKIERIYGLDRRNFAPKTLFISHETYTPARGGSASAEVQALKKAFGPDADKVIVSNVKGFTGHTMGASLEEVVAVRALNTGIAPPIANYKEPDPELSGINLSKGGKYDFEYALRFAAGFGSHMAMSFMQRLWKEGEPRIENPQGYKNWLKEISSEEEPELEIVHNTLRIKDKKTGLKQEPEKEIKEPATIAATKSPAPATSHQSQKVDVVAELALPETQVTSHKSQVISYEPQVPSPSLSTSISDIDSKIKNEILDMISEKTGYPKDMLDIDLDMEADLGIDTVKQAELFAMIREHYDIPRKENLSLKDYPTIRHCIKFVMDET